MVPVALLRAMVPAVRPTSVAGPIPWSSILSGVVLISLLVISILIAEKRRENRNRIPEVEMFLTLVAEVISILSHVQLFLISRLVRMAVARERFLVAMAEVLQGH